MKFLTYITKTAVIFFLALGVFATAQAQSPESTIEKVASAIKSADSNALASFFNTSVEVTTPDADNMYSSKQATFVIKEFFSNYALKNFEILHQGNSGITYYATGSTSTDKGNFDTNIFIKNTGGKYLITQIRFEAQ